MSKDRQLQDKLGLITAAFAAKLPGRLHEMDGALQLARDEIGNGAHLHALHRLLHSLGGSAGVFGLAELGLQARAIEQNIELMLAAGTWTGQDLAELAPALQALQRWLPESPAQCNTAPDKTNT